MLVPSRKSIIIFLVVIGFLALFLGLAWVFSQDRTPQSRLVHDADILRMAFSPDSRFLATTTYGGNCDLLIWDVKNGTLVNHFSGCLNGERDEICGISYSLDGQHLVITQCYNKAIQIIDRNTGKITRTFMNLDMGPDPTRLIAFHPSGETFLTLNKIVRIWDYESGSEIFQLGENETPVNDAEFSPDGHFIATANSDRTVHIWNEDSGDEIIIVGHEGAVNDIEFSPDSKTVFTASNDGTIRRWDMSGNEVSRFEIQGDWIRKVFYDSTTQQVIAVGLYSDVWIFDVETQQEIKHFSPAIGTRLTTAAISPDKSTFALAYSNVVTIWSTKE